VHVMTWLLGIAVVSFGVGLYDPRAGVITAGVLILADYYGAQWISSKTLKNLG